MNETDIPETPIPEEEPPVVVVIPVPQPIETEINPLRAYIGRVSVYGLLEITLSDPVIITEHNYTNLLDIKLVKESD